MTLDWKKGRGKLGIFKPLLGTWRHSGESPIGVVTCTRTFQMSLNNKWLVLDAVWEGAKKDGSEYVEHCLFGVLRDGDLGFVSFVNDGTQSQGTLASAEDVHPQALCFEADMKAGRARQMYWPHESGGLGWRVDAKVKAGWSTMVSHRYEPLEKG